MSPFKKFKILKKNSSSVWFCFNIFSSSFFSSSVSCRALEVSAIQDTPNRVIRYSGRSGLEELQIVGLKMKVTDIWNLSNKKRNIFQEDHEMIQLFIEDLIILSPVPAWRLSTQMLLLSASSLMVILSKLSVPPTFLTTHSRKVSGVYSSWYNKLTISKLMTKSPDLEGSKGWLYHIFLLQKLWENILKVEIFWVDSNSWVAGKWLTRDTVDMVSCLVFSFSMVALCSLPSTTKDIWVLIWPWKFDILPMVLPLGHNTANWSEFSWIKV